MRLIQTCLIGCIATICFVSQTVFAATPATTQASTQPTTQPATQPSTQPTDDAKHMEALWEDLGKEEPWCSRAILDFYDRPKQSVAFFKDHLKPLKIDEKDLDDALTALANDDDKIWKPAYEKLQYFDPRLNRSTQKLLEDVTDPVARVRLASLLTGCSVDQWKGYDISYQNNGNWSYLCFSKNGGRSMYSVQDKVSQFSRKKTEWVRNDRALVILQRIGTPDAIAILKDMSTGAAAAQSTKIAKAALDSLGQLQK